MKGFLKISIVLPLLMAGCTHYRVEHSYPNDYKQRNISVTSGVYDNGVYTDLPSNTTITIIENNPVIYPNNNFYYNRYPHHHNRPSIHYPNRPIIIKHKK